MSRRTNPYIRLAERLNALVPGEYPKKTMLASTGAEAVENAVKIARAYTGRSGVIAATSGFHGRTLMALALTGKIVPYKKGFGPFPGEVYHIPFPDAYRGGSATASLEALDRLFKSSIEPARVAAIIIEPVQGEGDSTSLPLSSCKVCVAFATSTASCSSRMKCRPGSGGPASCSRSSMLASHLT